MINNDRGQSLISKYVWVIETIYRRRKISFKELNELWLCDDISRGVDIPKRTFDNWRYVIWDMFGINIANKDEANTVIISRMKRILARTDFVPGFTTLSV